MKAYIKYKKGYIAGAKLPYFIDPDDDKVNGKHIVLFVHDLGEPPNSRTTTITTRDGSDRIAPGNIKWAGT
jgi:hypothetical protein